MRQQARIIDLGECNYDWLIKLKIYAQDDSDEAAKIFGVSPDVAGKIAELPVAQLRNIAFSGILIPKLDISMVRLETMLAAHPSMLPMVFIAEDGETH